MSRAQRRDAVTPPFSLFRGLGRLCRIEVLNCAGGVARLVLVDQSGTHPYAGVASTWEPPKWGQPHSFNVYSGAIQALGVNRRLSPVVVRFSRAERASFSAASARHGISNFSPCRLCRLLVYTLPLPEHRTAFRYSL